MLAWICENIVTVIVSLVLLLFIAVALISIIKDKKNGNCSCGSSCSGCAMSGSCHKKQ